MMPCDGAETETVEGKRQLAAEHGDRLCGKSSSGTDWQSTHRAILPLHEATDHERLFAPLLAEQK